MGEEPVVTLRTRIIKWAKRGMFVSVVGIAVLCLFGAVYQSWKTAETEAAYPMPGRLVDLGTHKLHVDVEGEGPVVVMEGGVACSSWEGEHIQDEVAKFATAVTYDRAGLGWSESGPQPRSPDRIVEELRAMLQRAELYPPYIMVGESFGGFLVRYYASKYPSEVAGVVLLDGNAFDVAPDEYDAEVPPAKMLRLLWILSNTSRVGGARLLLSLTARGFPGLKDMPDDFIEQFVAMKSRTKELRAAYHEVLGVRDWRESVGQMAHLGDIPLTVLMATGEVYDGKDWWIPAQKELGSLSNNVRWIEVDSGHVIAYERPEVFLDALKDMVARVYDEPISE